MILMILMLFVVSSLREKSSVEPIKISTGAYKCSRVRGEISSFYGFQIHIANCLAHLMFEVIRFSSYQCRVLM